MKKVLTIAGSDPFGGAGMQADIKTMTAHDVYSMTCVTLLSVQNSLKFYQKEEVSPEFLEAQIDAIFEDEVPDAIKTGMLLSSELIRVVADKIKKYKPKNVVIDPVMIAHRYIKLIEDEAISTMIDELIPLADIITPNLGEAEIISKMDIRTKDDMIEACKLMYERFGCVILLKGGVSDEDSDDLLCVNGEYRWIKSPKIDTENTRGTGCTLSAAIASNLAKDMTITDSVIKAKEYVYEALKSGVKIGHGKGSIHHSYNIK